MKVNVFGLKVPENPVTEIVVTDKSNPGVEVVFKLRSPDLISMSSSFDTSEYWKKYYMEPDKDGKVPELSIDGEVIKLTESVIQTASLVLTLQAGKKEENYEFHEIVMLMKTMPDGMLKVLNFVNNNVSPEGKLGNQENFSKPATDQS